MKQINNLTEFIEARGFGEESFKDIERNTYKYTDCGAWITHNKVNVVGTDYIDQFGVEHECEFVPAGITVGARVESSKDGTRLDRGTPPSPYSGYTVGSIVEGVDCDCTPETVTYPFKMDEFWQAMKNVENQADEIWKNTHGCEDCWPDGTCNDWCEPLRFGAWPINKECKTCEGEGTII